MFESFKHNWVEKVMAFTITVMLMLYVQSATNPYVRRAFSVPLEYVDKPFNGQVRDFEKRITVYVSGEKARVDAVQPSEIRAYLSLKDAKIGANELPVTVRLSDSSLGLTVEAARNREVVELGQQVTKRMPIIVDLVGEAPEGFIVNEPAEVTPDSARMSGWKDQVDQVESLRVRVDLRNVKGNIGTDFPIIAYDRNSRPVPETSVKMTPEEAYVKFNLTPLPKSKTVIVDVPVQGQPAFPFHVEQIKITPPQVELFGDPDKLASIAVIRAEPIKIDGITGTQQYKPKLIIPSGLSVKNNQSVNVEVIVQRDRETPAAP